MSLPYGDDMDRELIDHLMHTFCHVKDSRRFCYDESMAWLCHRCSGIYSSFLFFAVLAWFTRWRGTWTTRGTAIQAYWSAGGLLALCGLQVLVQQFDGNYGGGGYLRFAVGGGVGLALLQVALVQKQNEHSVKPFVLLFIPLWLLHIWLNSSFYGYHVVTTFPGLVLMYFWINHLALLPWLSRSLWKKALVLTGAVALEWLFLYYMNVGRHHV